MRARWLWTALSSACALISIASMAACSEVESCKEDEPGCINSPPDDSGNCRAGLVLDESGTACIPKGGSSTKEPDLCGCEENELCRQDMTCVNVCITPTTLPARTSATKTCRPAKTDAPYDFAKAAVALCYQGCIRRAALCGTACNPAVDCTPAAAMALTTPLCPGGMPECAMKACEVARDTPCAQQQCPPGSALNCTGVSCTNDCITTSPMSTVFINDGLCDDGDLSNADSVVCDWGQDCGDCGPRRGTAPVFSRDLGDPCFDAIQCGGDRDDVTMSTGWCVETEKNRPLYRCVPDCSAKGATCPSGYECHDLLQEVTGSDPVPVVDQQNMQARACFPSLCGT
jgi:hypothetical protein